MNKKVFLTNKYTLSVLILLGCLGADILLHRGMSRVIIPSTFTDKRKPVTIASCSNGLLSSGKHWYKALNHPEFMDKLPDVVAGIECDVYFDTSLNNFRVYHDTSNISEVIIDSILEKLRRFPTTAIWLDFKNLSSFNEKPALKRLLQLRKKYQLDKRALVESVYPQYLRSFCDSGFFTSYYVPFFNPYGMEETALINNIDSIAHNLNNYPTSAVSGYYFQYPVLKKYFPNMPILTWTDESNISLVSNIFNRHLESTDQVKIVLYPHP